MVGFEDSIEDNSNAAGILFSVEDFILKMEVDMPAVAAVAGREIENPDQGLEANLSRSIVSANKSTARHGAQIDEDSFGLNSGQFWQDRHLTRALRNFIYSYPVMESVFERLVTLVWCYTCGEDGYRALPFHSDYIRIYETPRDRVKLEQYQMNLDVMNDMMVTMNIITSFIMSITDNENERSPYRGLNVGADVSICVSLNHEDYRQHEDRWMSAMEETARAPPLGQTTIMMPHGGIKRRHVDADGNEGVDDQSGGGVAVIHEGRLPIDGHFARDVRVMFIMATQSGTVRLESGDGARYTPEAVRGVWIAIRFVNL